MIPAAAIPAARSAIRNGQISDHFFLIAVSESRVQKKTGPEFDPAGILHLIFSMFLIVSIFSGYDSVTVVRI